MRDVVRMLLLDVPHELLDVADVESHLARAKWVPNDRQAFASPVLQKVGTGDLELLRGMRQSDQRFDDRVHRRAILATS
jgi:hypothetical protein